MNTKVLRQVSVKRARCGQSPNFRDVAGSQLGSAVSLSGKGDYAAPTLLPLIPHVFEVSSKEQVAGVHAGGDIAAMENLHSERNGAVVDFPRKPMGRYPFATKTISDSNAFDLTISKLVRRSTPQPASVWFDLLDFRPEANFKRNSGDHGLNSTRSLNILQGRVRHG